MENITPHMVNAWLWLGLLAFWLSVAAWSNRNVSHEGFAGRLQTVMPLAVAFLLMFYDRHRPLIAGRLYQLPPLEWAGVAATLAGVLFAVWARLHLGRYWSGVVALKEDHRIIRTGPYRRLNSVIRLDIECSPCYSRTCWHHSCLQKLDVAPVLELAHRQMNGASADL